MSKIYAVKNGRHPGLYSTWSAAEAAVNGYPGAKHKSFLLEEATAAYRYLHGRSWPGTEDPFVVSRADGTAALVDPEGDIAEQIAAVAPTRRPPPVPGGGTVAGLRAELLVAGVHARGAGALLADINQAHAGGRLTAQAAARLRRVVCELAR